MNTQTFSPRELADVVGVSESSIKRWVDAGLISVTRTAGGHRRITLREALRFIREREMKILRPERLGLPDLERLPAEARERELTDEVFYHVLRRGDAGSARGLLTSAYLDGTPVADLLDGPVAFALNRLGSMYETDERGVFVEHRATNICIEAINQIRMLMQAPATADGAVAVGGGPAQDIYILPNLMAAAVLSEAGFEAVNLGPHTPNQAFRHAVDLYEPELVWIALTSDLDGAERDEVAALMEILRERDVRVVVGGRTAYACKEAWPGHVTVAETMNGLSESVRGLVPLVEDREVD